MLVEPELSVVVKVHSIWVELSMVIVVAEVGIPVTLYEGDDEEMVIMSPLDTSEVLSVTVQLEVESDMVVVQALKVSVAPVLSVKVVVKVLVGLVVLKDGLDEVMVSVSVTVEVVV